MGCKRLEGTIMNDPGVSTAPPPARPRMASTHLETAGRLGALKDLPGFWQGVGFSLIARPDFSGNAENGSFLQLNMLQDTLDFTPIGSPVFNRGSIEDDITIYGVTYLHRVVDEISGGALHIEPGMWLNIPATTDPTAEASIARLATIPHGNAVCTTGFTQIAEFSRLPEIPPANTVPFPVGGTPPAAGTANPYQEFDLSIPSNLRSDPIPAAITQALVDDPNQLLRDTLTRQVEAEGKTLKSITRLITTTDHGGVSNIPFITNNADTPAMESVFAIETVTDERGNEFMQLQYSQTVLINFNGMTFPHVTVGTLVKSF
jgi:hypothetical protein